MSLQWLTQGRDPGGRPLFLRQTEAQRRIFFVETAPALISGLDDCLLPHSLSEGLDPPLPYTSANVPKLGTPRSLMNEKKKTVKLFCILQFRIGGSVCLFTLHFTYCQVFWFVPGVSRSVPAFTVLVHADSLDEVLRRDYSKYFSLLGSN